MDRQTDGDAISIADRSLRDTR